MNTTLEKEIRQSEERLNEERKGIESEITALISQIIKYTKWGWWFVYIGLGITIVGILLFLKSDLEEFYGLNLLGDFMAGTVASVWALAGLFFIYVAFLGQKQQLLNQQMELKYSQLEIKYTRLELKGQREEMAAQNNTLRIQRFENTFFEMIKIHHEIIDKIIYYENGRQFPGRHGIATLKGNLSSIIKKDEREYCRLHSIPSMSLDSYLCENSEAAKTLISTSYTRFWHPNQTYLSHYFRNLYHCFKYVYKSPFSKNEKQQYSSLIRAQLSQDELYLLFFNCLIENLGNPKFLFLVYEFDLFQNMDRTKFKEYHILYYNSLIKDINNPFIE